MNSHQSDLARKLLFSLNTLSEAVGDAKVRLADFIAATPSLPTTNNSDLGNSADTDDSLASLLPTSGQEVVEAAAASIVTSSGVSDKDEQPPTQSSLLVSPSKKKKGIISAPVISRTRRPRNLLMTTEYLWNVRKRRISKHKANIKAKAQDKLKRHLNMRLKVVLREMKPNCVGPTPAPNDKAEADQQQTTKGPLSKTKPSIRKSYPILNKQTPIKVLKSKKQQHPLTFLKNPYFSPPRSCPNSPISQMNIPITVIPGLGSGSKADNVLAASCGKTKAAPSSASPQEPGGHVKQLSVGLPARETRAKSEIPVSSCTRARLSRSRRISGPTSSFPEQLRQGRAGGTSEIDNMTAFYTARYERARSRGIEIPSSPEISRVELSNLLDLNDMRSNLSNAAVEGIFK